MFRVFNLSTVSRFASSIQHLTPAMPKRTPGRMFSLQQSLPKLPVPALENTLQKYLKSVRPLLSDEEFAHTKKVVEKFKVDPGPLLQDALELRARKEVNWLSDWWRHTAYLEFRDPVVVNVSPGVVFPRQNYTDKEGQLRFAAKLISGVLDYKTHIDNETLAVEYMGKKPLCMDQYFKILSACRIPGKKIDQWQCFPPDKSNPPKHVTIIHNNAIFSLDVYGPDNTPLTTEQLYKQLVSIADQSSQPSVPIGILTTENRTKWAHAYKRMCSLDAANKKNFDGIHHSIMAVCIDNEGSDDVSDERSAAARLMMHGGGSTVNSGNRWFDKTVQFVVGKNGVCGLNYEHTSAEGPPVISLADHVVQYCSKNQTSETQAGGSLPPPRKLEFTTDKEILSGIEDAKESLDALVGDVDLNVLKFTDFGKNFPKSQKMSPDSFIQNAIQLTYYRMYGEPAAQYETASLRQFQYGRTDTIRTCSIDSLNFCQAFVDTNTSKEVKLELLKKAVTAHKDYTIGAINGQGIDRHLLGLKLTAIKNGLNVPDLHMDMAYSTSNHFKLSTSQVPAKCESVLVFGPVVPDGYGVCYNPQETQILFGVSAFDVSPQTDSKHYIKVLNQTLCDMRDLFVGSVQAKL